ncbi:hypothetical protein Mco01_13830 [Microbispora corallina]|uniref:Uncharacterized protein n=1 Tax=Microbispora corallina TaxID=83302 RepID=A0ABQ4FU80_9ACTN|nr:hypothetical protein Mco01_13830 [Microbispora corallina]
MLRTFVGARRIFWVTGVTRIFHTPRCVAGPADAPAHAATLPAPPRAQAMAVATVPRRTLLLSKSVLVVGSRAGAGARTRPPRR